MPATVKKSAIAAAQITITAAQLERRFKGNLTALLGTDKEARRVASLVQKELKRTLNDIGRVEIAVNADKPRTVTTVADTAPVGLPMHDLKPEDVISQNLVEMSLSQLYRATKAQRFYTTKPRGKSNGRVYPAWQFVDPVPALLPEVLELLSQQGETSINGRLLAEEDYFNELCAAEVLAGQPFGSQLRSSEAKQRILALPASERLALVKQVLGMPSRAVAIG